MIKLNIYNTSKTIFLLVFFFIAQAYLAQVHYFDNYSVKDGLAQSSVYAIQQDKEGYLWLGTSSGVSKFDGYNFVNYTTEDGLAEGAVKAVYIDKKDNVWLGHNNGGVTRISGSKIEIALSLKADITSFAEDINGGMWISSYGDGAIVLENPYDAVKDFTFNQFKGQEGLSDIVFQILSTTDKKLYFVTDVGIKKYDYKTKIISRYQVDQMPSYFQIITIYQDSQQNQWFGTYNGGLYKYHIPSKKFTIYDVRDGLAYNWITSICEDKKNNIWIGTWGGGISKINNDSVESIGLVNGLPDDKIRNLTTDIEGNLLIGTKENGLAVYKGDMFVSYNDDVGLADNQVWSILKDKNKTWVATNKGISLIQDNKIVHNFNQENGFYFDEVRFLKKDKSGNIWAGTWGGGVMRYNEVRNRFDMNYIVNSFMTQQLITALEVDHDNNLWVGTTDGLVYYEVNNQVADRLSQSNGLAGNEISAIYCDSKNNIWVGSRAKGLTKISGAKITKVDLVNKLTPTCFIEDEDGNLWIGTEGQGVIITDGIKIINQIKSKDGLLSNYISLLNIDEKGAIWIGSNKGLNKYNTKTKEFRSYSEKMGFVGIETKHNATYKDEEGNLWFGTIKGAIKLKIDKQTKNLLEPITHIYKMRVNLEERDMVENLKLSYTEKSIVFDYGSICLTNPKNVYYKVMLEGLDKDWSPPTQQTYASYSPLPPGNYTFKVIASNNDGVWNKTPKTYSFVITPPIWMQTWFIATCAILIIVIVIAFIKYREKQLIREKNILEEKVAERTEEVVQKSAEIERKNKDIIDSITYAKRIQDAILPSNENFTKQLNQTFVLFKPKDIVSGDFYWFATKGNKSLFAAVDCTGHGVPGAFMSIVGYNLLDKIVGEHGITQPADILNKLNKGVEDTLRKEISNDDVKDGMDIALCAFDRNTGLIEFAGAYNSLYIVSKHEVVTEQGEKLVPNMVDENGLNLYEIKPDRFPIGSYSETKKQYTNNGLKLQKNDTVYLFSDGYADQFGGKKGKKFRYKQFKQLLLSVNDKSMPEQKQILDQTFLNWKGNMEQVDDVIVIGSKL